MKKLFELAYGFRPHCTSINGRFSESECCLHSRTNNKIKIFLPFGNEFLPLSKNISLTACPIICPLKQKDLCDYDTRFIMSSGLMFDDIIMNIISNKKLVCHNEENDCIFTQIENNIIYMYRVSLQELYWKKELTSVYWFHV